MVYLCARTLPDRYGLPFVIKLSLLGERSEQDTIRGVQIRAGAVYIYMYGGTYDIIVAHATHT